MTAIVKVCRYHGSLTIDQVDKRSDNNGYKCKQCRLVYNREYIKGWRQENLDLVRERAREARKKDPEKYREYDRKQRRTRLTEHRYRDVLNKHKITSDDYEKMREEHQNLCAICRNPETRKSRTKGHTCRLVIDHCHVCEDNGHKGLAAIRGMLCFHCNVGLSNFKDDPVLLQKAINYLQNHIHI